MEFFDALKARHSIRAYTDMPVEEKMLDKILEAVNQAPSAGNEYCPTQGVGFRGIRPELYGTGTCSSSFLCACGAFGWKIRTARRGFVLHSRCDHCLHVCYAVCNGAGAINRVGGRV